MRVGGGRIILAMGGGREGGCDGGIGRFRRVVSPTFPSTVPLGARLVAVIGMESGLIK
jgi:hypothetical protein